MNSKFCAKENWKLIIFNIFFKTVKNSISWIIIGATAAAFYVILLSQYVRANIETEALNANVLSRADLVPDYSVGDKKAPAQAKGLYLTAYSAGSKKKMDEIIKLIGKTELNAVVIDIKDYSGKVLYGSKVKLANDLKLVDNRIGNVRELIAKLHRREIYVIARQTVFQDPILAGKKPEWAIRAKGGGIWRDYKGLSWVDPTRREVWAYNMQIAKEAIELGFDEINFDYVRFPSDGNMSAVVYTNGNKKRWEIMGEFYKFVGETLSDLPAYISLDLFGLTMEATSTNDMQIGQRIAGAVDHVDYISPMMYPSHYPSGHLKLANPAAQPALVIDNGMKKGARFFVGKRAKVRPWLQAFNMGAVYGAEKIRAQINAVEKYDNAGWLLWNAANRYTSEGLKED